ncbi:MAG: N-acetylmuramoyl-L-alanine amidase, partial [Verrucomicrobiota bacterium]|nr:N-acetylmuramoyl-L-alanine amidase [Verrucomicrobiota bacterium]
MISRLLFPRLPLLLLLFASPALAVDHLSNPLADPPNWKALARFQKTITHDEFYRLLLDVYCPHGIKEDVIRVDPKAACVLMDKNAQTWFTLRFARDDASSRTPVHRWKTALSLPRKKRGGVLSGLKIALDPGHIGGEWAKIEERWFKMGDTEPVEEGEMTLRVAKMLAERLRGLGARVSFVREKNEPVTPFRPNDFKGAAIEVLKAGGTENPRETFDGPDDPQKERTIRWQSEILFYRSSEIRQRARRVNLQLRPDLVLCLHFNAEAWGDERNPTFIDKNHLHLLVNGSYAESEVTFDDERFEMVRRLLSRAYDEELKIADTVAATMAKQTGLPPYQYTTDNVTKVGTSGYVYARDLAATRLYQCPVVYFEPYVMNNSDVFARVQAGDYEGTRLVNGVERPSIFREYVDSVV